MKLLAILMILWTLGATAQHLNNQTTVTYGMKIHDSDWRAMSETRQLCENFGCVESLCDLYKDGWYPLGVIPQASCDEGEVCTCFGSASGNPPSDGLAIIELYGLTRVENSLYRLSPGSVSLCMNLIQCLNEICSLFVSSNQVDLIGILPIDCPHCSTCLGNVTNFD